MLAAREDALRDTSPAKHAYPLEPLFGRVLSPFHRFLRLTTAGSIVLIAATVAALGFATILGAVAA